MPFSHHSRRWQDRRRRRFFLVGLIGLVFLSAALYLYGRQFRVWLLLNQGGTYLQQGNLDRALQTYNRILEIQANHAQAIDAIGQVYLTQGDLVRAEIKYEQAMKLGLRASRRLNHTRVGNLYLAKGLYGPSELEFHHALELTPKELPALLGYALSLQAQGKISDAIDAYRNCLAQNPDLKIAQTQLALARQEFERGFVYYLFDRQQVPLARFSLLRKDKPRYYPLAQYAAHLVGYTNAAHGNAGLEASLAPYLPGNTVTLTVNADWQRLADRAMGWRKGSLVALQPKTGEILALVNHPSFNPNSLDEDWTRIVRNRNQPLKNRATESLYEPGSIFKIITAAAALESRVDLTRIFPVMCPGGVRFDDKAFWCWRRHGRVDSLQMALDTSCNVAMAQIGFALGPDRLYEYSNRFGFGAPISSSLKSNLISWSLPVVTSSAPIVEDHRFELAQRACGLGPTITISPLHAALLAATIANNGQMMSPYYIREIKNIRGEVLAEGEPTVLRTPIPADIALQLKKFMIDTVEHGIGRKARVTGIQVGGKTGTTGDSEVGLNGWFICFAPADNPTIAVAVYAEKEGTGMDVAAPIAQQFLEDVLKPN